MSFAEDGREVFRWVLDVASQIKSLNNYKVTSDIFDIDLSQAIREGSLRNVFSNQNDWLVHNIKTSKFIIFCVTPKYLQYIQAVNQDRQFGTRPGDQCQAIASENQLHTRFIYDQALSEYISNGSRNYRFIPVMFPGVTYNQIRDVALFAATKCFQYPEQLDALKEFLQSFNGNQ